MTLHQRLTLLSQNFAASFLAVLSAPLRLLPRKAVLGFGAALGELGSLIAPKLRDRARSNLLLAYGDTMDAAERDRIV